MKSVLIRILSFSLLLITVSCAILQKPESQKKEILLLNNLEKWETFRIDGIIEYNYKQFSFRKNISARKKHDVVRIDVYDAGIFGIKPTPFISIYFDSLLIIRSQDQPGPVVLLTEEYPEFAGQLGIFINLPDLYQYKETIITKGNVILDNDLEFIFNEKLLLKKINDPRNDTEVILYYDDELTGMDIYVKNEKILNILVDRIIFNIKEIKKLT